MHATTQQDISTLLCLFCRYIYNLQQQQQQDHRTQLTELRMNLNLSTTAGSTATQTTLLFLPQHICVHPPLKMLVGGKRKEYKKTPKSFITMFTNTKLSKGQAGLWSQSQFKVKLCLRGKSKVLWRVYLIAAQEGNFDWMKRISGVQKQDWLWKLI